LKPEELHQEHQAYRELEGTHRNTETQGAQGSELAQLRLRLEANLQESTLLKDQQQKTIERLTSQCHALRISLATAQHELNTIKGSRSWKLVQRYWIWKSRLPSGSLPLRFLQVIVGLAIASRAGAARIFEVFARVGQSLACIPATFRSAAGRIKGVGQKLLALRGVTAKDNVLFDSLPTSQERPLPEAERQRLAFVGCTIVAKNTLSKARVLAESFRRYHPGAEFCILLVDRVEGYFDPLQDNFEVVSLEDIGIANLPRLCFQYSIIELCTAVKPYFLLYLLEKRKARKLVYLDPDILITNCFANLLEILEKSSIVLTPHITSPIHDAKKPSEHGILLAGTFNLGFIAVSDTPVTHRFLSWWCDKVNDGCFFNPNAGFFVDQKWIDLVPSLFEDVQILRHPGYNVAYWNLQDRRIKIKDGEVQVNGELCHFFHFSGFDPDNLHVVSRHQDRLTMQDVGEAKTLFQRYSALCLAHGYRVVRRWPYAFDYFDNGARIPELARRLYFELGENRKRFPDPFVTRSSKSFLAWLNEAVDSEEHPQRRITRLWHEIYERRPDVQVVYPDILGADRDAFLEWILNRGRHEHQVDRAFVLCRYSSLPTLDFQGSKNGLPFGVNLAGYMSSEKGTGEGARCSVRALRAAGIPFVVNNIIDPDSVNIVDMIKDFSEDHPYAVNLIHVNADQVPSVVRQWGAQTLRGRHNVGYWTWELSEFPEEWYSSFSYYDEIWVPSKFVLDAISRASPIPVLRMPLALPFDSITAENLPRERLGLPKDKFIFLFVFDCHSFTERKNPLGLIEAFKRAFSSRADAWLVIKTSHSSDYPEQLYKLRRASRGTQCKIIDAVLTHKEVLGLIGNCDCYASLHRSEGFGSTPAEAMSMGKPVIATGYSGNLDFMNPANSFLVKYRLVEIQEDHGPYRKGMQWAEPDVDHAAELMRFVYENRDIAAGIGKKASQDMLEYFSATTVGRLMRQRLLAIAAEGKISASTDEFVRLSMRDTEERALTGEGLIEAG
jgi:glycosyltransferase involved in cell wall biosynthesis